ncbi:hypothetical protein AWM68_19775 [Fictibacillus phosphorivorans]|uniref:Uncharacterized protein n=1 Tax=Fictibacillus phosphorivorans TaxID=1221500 RepID=A0A165NPD3_9BACL|nr:hypothetical protein [Fictibacillus phosphorivorans]KZE67032.1 hypothetical protein AWM68_19775 [Fictibacillus phosphorivorans]
MNCVSPDAWIQTFGSLIGSLIGAFLAGYFAVRVMKNQLDNEKNITLRSSLETFLKFNIKFQHQVHNVAFAIKEINKLITKIEFEYEDYAKLQLACDKFSEYISMIQDLPEDEVRLEIHSKYKNIQSNLGLLHSIAALFPESKQGRREELVKEFAERTEILEYELSFFLKYVNEIEEKLRKLS